MDNLAIGLSILYAVMLVIQTGLWVYAGRSRNKSFASGFQSPTLRQVEFLDDLCRWSLCVFWVVFISTLVYAHYIR
ncbi:hypothetical protein pEaSNUABM5_00067 [Erwinia phage pEa_SNUABM_5]|uniref:Uncharacterized protein n=1 Tax=Erwinia phage pEa_SNUABM_5 TaxID=2797313 RepID=A0A7T8EPW3_9CAUD|nr:hypothetical protein MPK73_gp067 [Erwinia phage pEa_SNUABM_5]QQO90209.1 hypothetical protein pEaSNUABM5_00067 [Erwinia phage pEa_SNUABM_5]